LLETGTMVGGYRVDDLLGEGGMGAVYRATQLSLDRVVALKVLTGELSDDPGFRERFRREGQRQAAIDHPHIVSVYEAGETDQVLFLAMRLVEGPTLKALLLARDIDHWRCLQILTQVADALDAAHAEGLIHRDVKPQNILIGARDHAYLADFGLTKGSDEDVLLTEPGHFVGTIDYISPEQARGEGATARSDVYSLCCVLHECLTGEVPFSRPTEPSVLLAHLTEPPPTVSDGHPELPVAIDAVIARGMAKDPDDRYPSAGELILDARRAFAAIGPGAPSQRTRTHRVDPTPAPDSPELAGATAAAAAFAPTRTIPAADPRPAPAGPETPGEATPAPTPTPRRRFPGIAAVGLLLVAAAVAGILVGGSGSSGTAGPAFTSSASVGPLELAFPAGWQRLQTPPQIPGLRFANPLVLAPPAPPAARLDAGTVAATGPTLLPAAFLALLPGPPSGIPVRIGTLEALRYSGLQPRGLAGPLTVYVVPTTQGVLTLACAPGAPAFAAACDRVVATAKLVGASAYPLGSSPAFAGQLTAALARLAAARRTGEAHLSRAGTAAAQAAADRELAAAYTRAAREVAAAAANPLVVAAAGQIAAALTAIARAYQSSASAAAANDRAGYAAAGRALAAAGPAAGRAIAGLRALGYTLSG
jgi:hypothetical protein